MSTPIFANNATSTLVGAINSTATTFNVADASQFPVPGAGQYFMATIEDTTQNPVAREIVQVTNVSGTTFTVLRAQEGTAALSFNAGVTVSNRLTAGVLTGLVEGLVPTNSLYIGAYASAPTNAPDGSALQAGMLYFNTTTSTLYEYNSSAVWVPVSANGTFGSGALYLGAFSTAPTTRNDLTPLQPGDSYFNTVSNTLNVWSGTAWEAAADVNFIQGDVVINGNLQVNQNAGILQGLTIKQDLNVEGSIILDGSSLVAVSEINGDVNSQNFPNGTKMIWGAAVTGTPLVFPDGGFPSICNSIVGVIIGDDAGDDPGCVLSFNTVTNLGCNVVAFRPTDGTLVNGRTVNFFAVGG